MLIIGVRCDGNAEIQQTMYVSPSSYDSKAQGLICGTAIMIYGGSIQPGKSRRTGAPLSISSCFESAGALMYGQITEDEMDDIVRHACPGPGGCGGMYTANTMASAIEVMGLTLPGSSSFPAGSPAKFRECENAAEAIRICLERDIKPRDLVTKESLENALVLTAALGGSTNSVLHFLAISHTADLDLILDDFKRVADKTPILANIKPFGKYMMNDLYDIGNLPSSFSVRTCLTMLVQVAYLRWLNS